MDGMLGIFQSISRANKSNLSFYISALEEHQCFQMNGTNANDPAVQHITGLLTKPTERLVGFLLLRSLLGQCSLEVLEQKGVLWTTLCIKACNLKESGEEAVVALAYENLGFLIKKSAELPELSKSLSGTHILKFCETLNKVKSTDKLAALKCLEISLKMFPGPCGGNARPHIENFLIKFIDSIDSNLVTWSGKCMHLLQQVRGGGVQGISYKISWQKYQCKIIGSLHETLDLLYANCDEVYDNGLEMEKFQTRPLNLSNDPIERASQMSIRYRNLVTYLMIAIREPYPVPKPFMPKKILNLVSRSFGVNCTMLQSSRVSDQIAIGALLPDVHVQLFKMIRVLISILKSHLSIYGETILGFIVETLKWTSSGKSQGFCKPYRQLRAAAYETLTLWCKTMKYGSTVEIIFEDIMDQIMWDITPFQSEMTLKVLSGARKHMSKKARRQLHKAQNDRSHLVQTHSKSFDPHNTKVVYSDQKNQAMCYSALQSLEMILLSSGCLLKPIHLKELHEQIIINCLECNELYTAHENTNLYSGFLCRKGLYDVLMAVVINPHYLCPPPTEMAIRFFSYGQVQDSNVLVRNLCARHLRTMEKILHPQKDSLIFPPDINDIKNSFKVVRERPEGMDEEDSDVSEEEAEPVVNNVANENATGNMPTKINSAQDENIESIKDDVTINLTKSLENNSMEGRNDKNIESNFEIIFNSAASPKKRKISTDESTIEVPSDNKQSALKKFCENTNTMDTLIINVSSSDSEDVISNDTNKIQDDCENMVEEPIVELNEELNEDDLVNEMTASFVNELNEIV